MILITKYLVLLTDEQGVVLSVYTSKDMVDEESKRFMLSPGLLCSGKR
jgi:transcriptional regulator of acetoin/glycerol metabolism